jgi:hypothetical protein
LVCDVVSEALQPRIRAVCFVLSERGVAVGERYFAVGQTRDVRGSWHGSAGGRYAKDTRKKFAHISLRCASLRFALTRP